MSLYITLDTCVWLSLLKVEFNNDDNYFEEICFWIENKHITHVVPTNIIDEWNRHKLEYQKSIVEYFERMEQENISPFKNNRELASTYRVEEIYHRVQKRIERVDLILSNHSEKAPFDDALLIDAGIRNLRTIAPNHKQDSFRDTVNILSLIQYLRAKGYTNSIFTTLNYKDFCINGAKRFILHDDLKTEFASANLVYEYFGEDKDYGIKLFTLLRKRLAANSFQVYLKEKRDKAEAGVLATKKLVVVNISANPDVDFLDNIRYLDTIMSKKKRTAVDEEIVEIIIGRHESYKQYFFKNIGNNGLV